MTRRIIDYADEAERARREDVREFTREPDDLLIPAGHRRKTLDGVLSREVPEHLACLDFAFNPFERSLILRGGYGSAIHDIQWALGRFWYVERLLRVHAFRWRDLVASNLIAQDRCEWRVPFLLIENLEPIRLTDGRTADPGQAERLLQYRLRARLTTVITIEGCASGELGLRPDTLALLRRAVDVELPASPPAAVPALDDHRYMASAGA